MPPEYQNVLVVAGEASGDMHAAALIEALKRLDPELKFYGVGGEKLREAGVKLIANSADMAVVGLTEVFIKLPLILKVMRILTRSFREEKPVAVILVDYPDFNLHLARKANACGIKVFYYISPQVWAWRAGRIKTIRRYVDKMAVILPFEASIYRKAGVDVEYVGHPILDRIPPPVTQIEAREKIGVSPVKLTVSLLPGSRSGEVAKLLPICLRAAELIRQKHGDVQFIMPLASTMSPDLVATIVKRYNIDVSIVSGAVYEVLAASDLAIVASGTATLEAALIETPLIIIYRVSWLSYLLGRIFIQVENIGLVNIVAGKKIVPELIQREANPELIAKLAGSLLDDKNARARMKSELSGIKKQLGLHGAAEKAARLFEVMLGRKIQPLEDNNSR